MENMDMKRIVMIFVAAAAIFMVIRYYQSHYGQNSVKVQMIGGVPGGVATRNIY